MPWRLLHRGLRAHVSSPRGPDRRLCTGDDTPCQREIRLAWLLDEIALRVFQVAVRAWFPRVEIGLRPAVAALGAIDAIAYAPSVDHALAGPGARRLRVSVEGNGCLDLDPPPRFRPERKSEPDCRFCHRQSLG